MKALLNIGTNGNTLEFNPNNFKSIKNAYNLLKDINTAMFGVNENGETISISANNLSLTLKTFQYNNWIRIQTYYTDGTIEEFYIK